MEALEEYGAESGQCEKAASRVLPHARDIDGSSTARWCQPVFGIYVCPKRRWFHHVSVLVDDYYVDALAGPDGLETEVYMETHWADREAFFWADLADDKLEGLAGWTSLTT